MLDGNHYAAGIKYLSLQTKGIWTNNIKWGVWIAFCVNVLCVWLKIIWVPCYYSRTLTKIWKMQMNFVLFMLLFNWSYSTFSPKNQLTYKLFCYSTFSNKFLVFNKISGIQTYPKYGWIINNNTPKTKSFSTSPWPPNKLDA